MGDERFVSIEDFQDLTTDRTSEFAAVIGQRHQLQSPEAGSALGASDIGLSHGVPPCFMPVTNRCSLRMIRYGPS